MTILEGGAESDRRAKRLTKEARRVAGRCLMKKKKARIRVNRGATERVEGYGADVRG